MMPSGFSSVVPDGDPNFGSDSGLNQQGSQIPKPPPKYTVYLPWVVGGAVLIGLHLVILFWSPQFAYDAESGAAGFNHLVLIELVACLCYGVFVGLLGFFRAGKFAFVMVVLVGFLLRMLMMAAEPIKANDFYRYLWDGAVTAHGHNPYTYSPEEILQSIKNPDAPSDVPMPLRQLAASSVTTLSRINHARLRTIYPPGVQGLFALAYWLTPFKIIGWRVILLLMDMATMGVLVMWLRSQKIAWSYSVVYWWNPLLIYESLCKGHFDLAVGIWLLLFVWALSRRRAMLAGAALALAISIKLWPLLLLPFLYFTFYRNQHRLIVPLSIFAIIMGIMMTLFYPALENVSDSGVIAYAQSWQRNAGLYRGFYWLMQQVSSIISFDARLVTRIAVVSLLFSVSIWLAWRTREKAVTSLAAAIAVVILLMLLLSPVLYPWYYLPLLPLAAITRKWSFLILTLLLPMTYFSWETERLRWLLWFLHAPVWGAFMWEFWLGRIFLQRSKKHRCLAVKS
jgi:alpha-1,6-mannosyltransferase